MTELEYTHLTADESALQPAMELAASHFPDDHPTRSINYLRWLYLRNPAGPATLVIAVDGTRWAGMLALVPLMLSHDGRPQPACFCVNVLSHPAYRGRNIFVNLIKLSQELLSGEGRWLIGHPNAAAVPGWTRRKMSFRDTLRPSIPNFMPWQDRWQGSAVRSRAELDTLPAAVWRGTRPGVRIQYSPAFMAWRYLDHPCRAYELRAVRRRGQATPAGLTVTRAFKPGVRLTVDWTDEDCRALPGLIPQNLVMAPDRTATAQGQALWQPTQRKSMPFFVSTWGVELPNTAFHELTLGASDF